MSQGCFEVSSYMNVIPGLYFNSLNSRCFFMFHQRLFSIFPSSTSAVAKTLSHGHLSPLPPCFVQLMRSDLWWMTSYRCR